ncbi:hypothetical protein SAMN04487948_102447 [Halogranum amylolyticum]|uniref:DUF8048 domain-containing protein n=1 Tax=Halogranum amylolyticum TaxID=660520 RepID=A0A1H8PRV5_9EURY|nr:hypothetical protein [Halogranum amylolyticum]SEO44506.1 hypothetical protein SAMN04487948_102447 [Halogranum amylolyticum]
MSDVSTKAIREAPIDERVVEEAAAERDLETADVADALVVIDAELRGHHSDFEHGEYVTVEDRRAYAVSTDDWTAATETVDFEEPLVTAAREAHTRQAKLLFDSAVESVQFDEGTVGVVVGVDTAEEMV